MQNFGMVDVIKDEYINLKTVHRYIAKVLIISKKISKNMRIFQESLSRTLKYFYSCSKKATKNHVPIKFSGLTERFLLR